MMRMSIFALLCLLASTTLCFRESPLKGCTVNGARCLSCYPTVEDGNLCALCHGRYTVKGFNCGKKIAIPHCVIALEEQSNKCSVCEEGYAPSQDGLSCGRNTIPFCRKVYRRENVGVFCTECAPGFTVVPEDKTTRCVFRPSGVEKIDDCVSYSLTKDHNGKSVTKCTKCRPGFWRDAEGRYCKNWSESLNGCEIGHNTVDGPACVFCDYEFGFFADVPGKCSYKGTKYFDSNRLN